MKKYKVNVVRVAYGFRTIEVEATNEAEAKEIAIEEAGDLEFSESSSDFNVDNIEEVG